MSDLRGLEKGRAWEYRVHRAAFLAGWYVRRGVNLRERVHGSPQTMGEVDVLGVAFDVALTPRLLAGECKDRKGGAKEADRAVWLLGLSRILGADHILFAKPSISEGTYIWARPFDIILWDEAAVRAIEQKYDLAPEDGYRGSFNARLCERDLRPLRRLQGSSTARFRKAWDYLSGAFWYSGNANSIRAKRLAAYFEVLQETKGLPELGRESYVAEGLLALIASLLTTAGQVIRLSPARSRVALTDAFSSGVANAIALRDIAARADDYYRDALAKAMKRGPEGRTPLDVPRLADVIAQPPNWLGEYLTLAERLSERPQLATDLLRFADLLLFEHLLVGIPTGDRSFSFISAPQEELLRMVQLTAYFVQRVWGVQSSLIDRLLAAPDLSSDDRLASDRRPDGGEGSQLRLTEIRE
jgi:hypothetical protein